MSKQEWHLNKAVPLSLIFAVLVQFVVTISWVATLAGRVSANEKLSEGVPQITTDIAVIKTDLMHVGNDIAEIKGILKKDD